MRATHTYATLEISFEAFAEIADKLLAADYGHAFGNNGEIDMHGIAIVPPDLYRTPAALAALPSSIALSVSARANRKESS